MDAPDSSGDLLAHTHRTGTGTLRDLLSELHGRLATMNDGSVATYIPELAKMDADLFAITIVGIDGRVLEVGDAAQLFSLQSMSKPFVFGQALEDHGREHVLGKVNVEPTGEAFNSILLDEQTNRPFNPLVNAGAIATADLIDGRDFPERLTRLLKIFERYTGRTVHFDNSMFYSERATGHRNRAIAHLMRNFGMISDRIDETLDLYFQQCSIQVNCRDLAVMGATLANAGVNPITGEQAIRAEYVKDVLSIMFTCGMYDSAGSWAYGIGLPAKSGVSGGIIAVVPGQFGIGVFSPRIDARGNSARGVAVCRELSQRYGLHVFEAGFRGKTLKEDFEN
ncbi:Glutaminase 1 [Caulifigura coniformis]|uniref:Glutaminase n=1 Tax=Caulifigura coniformis TaxID=2527983 RepID=A0A517S7K6_9PLAN|nr:glutaminase A [Caulifigura coniformis]QDT52111.1 Glutaminase 1 [Caulifigura coniformis]